MEQDILNTTDKSEPQFNIGQKVYFDKHGKFENDYTMIEGKISGMKWDSDKRQWLYHISVIKQGDVYSILFVKEKNIRQREDFYKYHEKKGES